MLPRELKPEDFQKYPPEARAPAAKSVPALRQLPLSFLPNLLREVIEYDYRFPAERMALTKELDHLGTLPDRQSDDLLGPFYRITRSPQLENFDWINSPARFVEWMRTGAPPTTGSINKDLRAQRSPASLPGLGDIIPL